MAAPGLPDYTQAEVEQGSLCGKMFFQRHIVSLCWTCYSSSWPWGGSQALTRTATISEEDERLSCYTMCSASPHICLESEC